MFIDTRRLEEGCLIESEVCIIGAGIAGIILALELERHGVDCCVLESGGYGPDDDTRDLYRGASIGLPYEFADGCRSRFLGGSSNCWGGWCRPLEEDDFERRDWAPYSGWPFTKSQLQPYYDRSHAWLGLGPQRFDPEYWINAISNADVRRHPFCGDEIIDVVSQFSPPLRFGRHYRKRLAQSSKATVYLHANVTDIRTDGGETVRQVQARTMAGSIIPVFAKIFVLAAGGIENARLLLVSNKDRPAGLGNQNDLVGRFFMDHPRMNIGSVHFREGWARNMLYDIKFHYQNSAVSAHGVKIASQFRLSQKVRERERLYNASVCFSSEFPGEYTGVKDAWVSLKRRLEGVHLSHRPLLDDLATLAKSPVDAAGFALARVLRTRSLIKRARFQVIAEPPPNPDSRVMLSSERDALGVNRVMLDWRVDDEVKRSVDRTLALLSKELMNAGVADVTLDAPLQGRAWPESFSHEGCWHHMGTTRMHESARHGVVDGNGRVHGTHNFYIAGSSVFPTAGSDFPTITIAALTLRLADHIAQVRGAGTAFAQPASRSVIGEAEAIRSSRSTSAITPSASAS